MTLKPLDRLLARKHCIRLVFMIKSALLFERNAERELCSVFCCALILAKRKRNVDAYLQEITIESCSVGVL
jgi:hypothetical protein